MISPDLLRNKENDQLKAEFKEKFNFTILRTHLNNDDVKDFIVIGNQNNEFYYGFCAIIINGSNKMKYMRHCRFEQIFKIMDTRYVLLYYAKPSTGIQVYELLIIKENQIEIIWGDGSYST